MAEGLHPEGRARWPGRCGRFSPGTRAPPTVLTSGLRPAASRARDGIAYLDEGRDSGGVPRHTRSVSPARPDRRAGPTTSARSASSRKIARRAHPRTTTWCSTPGASRRGPRGIGKVVHSPPRLFESGPWAPYRLLVPLGVGAMGTAGDRGGARGERDNDGSGAGGGGTGTTGDVRSPGVIGGKPVGVGRGPGERLIGGLAGRTGGASAAGEPSDCGAGTPSGASRSGSVPRMKYSVMAAGSLGSVGSPVR
jgi:hypothetical protein